MIKFYFHLSPNRLKVALYLEETGESYELTARQATARRNQCPPGCSARRSIKD